MSFPKSSFTATARLERIAQSGARQRELTAFVLEQPFHETHKNIRIIQKYKNNITNTNDNKKSHLFAQMFNATRAAYKIRSKIIPSHNKTDNRANPYLH